MTSPSPLLSGHEAAGAALLGYGPEDRPIPIVATFGAVAAEYAAVRRHAGVLDAPHRGVLRVRGDDRQDFLERLLTQRVGDMAQFEVRRSFWLNRKGRIDADLVLASLPDEILVLTDAHTVEPTRESLESYLFADDVTITNESQSTHVLLLHGPRAGLLVEGVSSETEGVAPGALEDRSCCRVRIAGAPVAVIRNDQCGAAGLALVLPAESTEEVYGLLAANVREDLVERGDERARPIGWHAFNTARLEAGTPLFNIDFGPTNLPHETGVLRERVNFKKGCYLGQEVVARMESLGKPKQVLVGLRRSSGEAWSGAQPVTGSGLFVEGSDAPVGAVTSSGISPMLGSEPVAFAMVRQKHAAAGAEFDVDCVGEDGSQSRDRYTVQPSLAFWSESATEAGGGRR